MRHFAHATELGVERLGDERASIAARHAHGQVAVVVDGGNQLLVNLAAQHLAHDIHSRRRGHALAVLKLDGDVVVAQRLVDGLAATVHDNRAHADDLEQHDVAHHVAAQLLINHGGSAIFDNNRLTGQVLNPRQRFEQQLRGCFVGFVRTTIACEFHNLPRLSYRYRAVLRCPQSRQDAQRAWNLGTVVAVDGDVLMREVAGPHGRCRVACAQVGRDHDLGRLKTS